jgi:hypothetical protein
VAFAVLSVSHYLRKWTRHDTFPLLHRDDPVYLKGFQEIYLAAWPIDFELINTLYRAQSEVDPVIAGHL